MGFFQSLFNKDRTGVKKEVIAAKNSTVLSKETASTVVQPIQAPIPNQQPNTLTTAAAEILHQQATRTNSQHSSNHLPASPPPTSPRQQLRKSSSINTSTSNNSKTPISLSPPVSQRTSQDIARPVRFQLCEDGTHIHHLTLPTTNRITASLNGLVTGIANKSLRLTQWTERKVTLDEIMKERTALNVLLHRNEEDSKETLSEKWGLCQETIGKGTSGVVRVAHKMEGTGERLYAVKVIICLKIFDL
jgi:hypothetical protein